MSWLVSCLLAASLMGSAAVITPADFGVPPDERATGMYTMNGIYHEGTVVDERGQEWGYSTDFPDDQEIPVTIGFCGNGTVDLSDDTIVWVSSQPQEAICSGEILTVDTEETMYWFRATESENIWMLDANEVGFVPVVGDKIYICYCDNETQCHKHGTGFSWTVVL